MKKWFEPEMSPPALLQLRRQLALILGYNQTTGRLEALGLHYIESERLAGEISGGTAHNMRTPVEWRGSQGQRLRNVPS